MIKLFHKSVATQLTVIIAVTMAMWMRQFIHPVAMPEPSGAAPLYGIIYLLLHGLPRVAAVCAVMLHLVTGALLNNLFFQRKLVRSNTLIPMLLYIMTMSIVPAGQTLTPTTFTNLIMLAILTILIANETRHFLSTEHIFRVSALLAIASLFHFPYILTTVPFFIIFITVYKLYDRHELAVLLLGFFAPFILLFTIYFLTGRIPTMLIDMQQALADWSHPWNAPTFISQIDYTLWILILAASMIYLAGNIGSQTSIYRNNADIVSLTLLGGLILMFYCSHITVETQAFAICFTYTGSVWLLESKMKAWISNTIFTLWVLFTIINGVVG